MIAFSASFVTSCWYSYPCPPCRVVNSELLTVTQDRDCLRVAASDLAHFGIAYYPQGKRVCGEITRHLTLMHDLMVEDEMLGRVE